MQLRENTKAVLGGMGYLWLWLTVDGMVDDMPRRGMFRRQMLINAPLEVSNEQPASHINPAIGLMFSPGLST